LQLNSLKDIKENHATASALLGQLACHIGYHYRISKDTPGSMSFANLLRQYPTHVVEYFTKTAFEITIGRGAVTSDGPVYFSDAEIYVHFPIETVAE